MAFQGKGIFKTAHILPILIASLVSAQPAKEVGRTLVDGVETPVFFEFNDGNPRKYFLDARGQRVDLASYQRRKALEKREKFGVFGKSSSTRFPS